MSIEVRTVRGAMLAVALLAVAGCSGASSGSKETAGEFVLRDLGDAFKGQSLREYAQLIPAQRAVVTEAQFEQFVRTDVYPAGTTAKIVGSYADATDIPETSLRRLRAMAVRVKITGVGQVVTESVHAYLLSGHWYWAMTSDALAEAQAPLGPRRSPCSGVASCSQRTREPEAVPHRRRTER